MKTVATVLVLSTLLAAPALAAETNLKDHAAMTRLYVIEAQTTMLGLCGATGDDADKILARNKEMLEKLEAGLSEEGKKSLPAMLAHIDDGVKTSWEKTPEATRAKSCEALKTSMSK